MRKSPYWPACRDFLVLLVIHGIGVLTMGGFHLMDRLLSPAGSGFGFLLALAVIFEIVRLFVIVLAPGWFLARLYWAWAKKGDALPFS